MIFLHVPSEDFTEQTNVYSCGAFHFPLLLVPPDVLLSEKYSQILSLFDFSLWNDLGMSTSVAMTDHTLVSVLEWEKRDGIGMSLCKWSEILMFCCLFWNLELLTSKWHANVHKK